MSEVLGQSAQLEKFVLFRMILDAAKAEERAIPRGLLRFLVAGFAAGLGFGSLVLILILTLCAGSDLKVPPLFLAAAMLQFGPIGGLVGTAVYVARLAESDLANPSDRHKPQGTGQDRSQQFVADRPLRRQVAPGPTIFLPLARA